MSGCHEGTHEPVHNYQDDTDLIVVIADISEGVQKSELMSTSNLTTAGVPSETRCIKDPALEGQDDQIVINETLGPLQCDHLDTKPNDNELSNLLAKPPPKFQQSLFTLAPNPAGAGDIRLTFYNLDKVIVSDTLEESGMYADIFRARVQDRDVCLKAIRRTQHATTDWWKAVFHEILVWSPLSHPAILPLYGIYLFQKTIALVSPWMENGNMCAFLNKHKDSNRVVLALGVAQGLKFLHENGTIHSDLKGPNILVNSLGRICLADFGSASPSPLGSEGGTVRWQAPELLDPKANEAVPTTKESDIYALACVAYEIFAGEVPFASITRDATVMYKVLLGQQPSRPAAALLSWSVWGLTDGIWSLMEKCWSIDPVKRPTIDIIIEELEKALPPDVDKEARHGDYLLPEQFRELTRSDEEKTEFSIGVFDNAGINALLSNDGRASP
ncbi:hypothetical protein DXG01_003775 [Tephrocybe rancida]|nr:hypothetical protein DXG01_003775 [Tephrocybe rancida]